MINFPPTHTHPCALVSHRKASVAPRSVQHNCCDFVGRNLAKTKLEKTKSKLAILKQKTKGSKAKLNQTLFNIDQASKKAKEVAKDKRNEKIVKKFIGEK